MKNDDKKSRTVLYGVLAYVAIVSCCIGVLLWRFAAVPFLDALDAGALWANAVVGVLLLGALALALRKAVKPEKTVEIVDGEAVRVE